MPFEINSPQDEQLLAAYTSIRNKVRDNIKYGVYPHVKAAMATYDELDAHVLALSQGQGNEPLLAAYHIGLMGALATETALLRSASEDVISHIEAIEALQPGTFGIPIPE